MKTESLEIHERSRLFRSSDAERYKLRLRIVGTLAELEKVREVVFNLEKEGSK